MELGLSLGESPARPFTGADKAAMPVATAAKGFGLGLGVGFGRRIEEEDEEEEEEEEEESEGGRSSAEPSLQLNLLPLLPGPRRSSSSPGRRGFPWASLETRSFEAATRGFDVNRPALAEEMDEGGAATAGAAAGSSSPNSTLSSFQMDFSVHRGIGAGERAAVGSGALVVIAAAGDCERPASSRGSDEDDNGAARKKLRLSKEQSAFLEESFKEHNTLNPKQKLALAKQLNLRPRQVEVWFQNRRARTKLKQTEVDCEYLKRCCETLTEENRRLQKELAELRALKTTNPFYMHLPATTLSMCPSCERVATTTASAASAATTTSSPAAAASATTAATTAPAAPGSGDHRPSSFAALLSRPRLFPFVTQQTPPPTTTS